MFVMSYWAYGNRQKFFNMPPEVKEHGNDVKNTLHEPFDFSGPNHTHLILAVLCFFFFDIMYFQMGHILFGFCKDNRADILSQGINEMLPNYWDAISGFYSKIWYATEVHNRTHCNVQRLSDDALERLRTAKRDENSKSIRNNCNYDILFNIHYQ